VIFLYRACNVSVEPVYSQDEPTYIMVGRWAHFWNETTRNWFVLVPRPDVLWKLNRERTFIVRLTLRQFMARVPRIAWLHLIEDVLGLRLCNVAQSIRSRRLFKRVKWLKRLAEMDARQDFTKFVERSEPPDWNVGSRMQ
jgi:hypothetical protein